MELDSLVASLALQAMDKLPTKRLLFGETTYAHEYDLVGSLTKLMSPTDGRFFYEYISDRTGLDKTASEKQLSYLIALNDEDRGKAAPEDRYVRVRQYLEKVVTG